MIKVDNFFQIMFVLVDVQNPQATLWNNLFTETCYYTGKYPFFKYM